MDESISTLFCVYRTTASPALISCPYDQRPSSATSDPGVVTIVFKGSQFACDKYMRDTRRLVQMAPRRMSDREWAAQDPGKREVQE